jgi:hypothetical protein
MIRGMGVRLKFKYHRHEVGGVLFALAREFADEDSAVPVPPT